MSAPAVAAIGVTSITATGVTLIGSMNTSGQTGSWQFAWGTSLPPSNLTPSAAASGLASAQIVQTTLTGLTTGQKYYFELIGTVGSASAASSPMTFTPVPPSQSAAVPTSLSVPIPHFSWPFTITSTGAQVVQQDSEGDVVSCVNAIAFCQQGEWPEDPTFGIPDQTFTTELDLDSLYTAIIRLEPRASVDIVQGQLDYTTGTWPVQITTGVA